MSRDDRSFSPTLLATFPEHDEERAAQLGAQQIEAFSLFELETTAEERLPGHVVLLPDADDYPRAALIAAAFDAEYASAPDYMSERGIEADPPARAGCGLFWFFPVMFTGIGAFQLYEVARTGWPALGARETIIGVGLLSLGLLMTVVFLRLTRDGARVSVRTSWRDATEGDVTKQDS